MSREFHKRLYEWYEKVAETIVALPDDAIARMDDWRDLNPEKSDADWPEVISMVGPRPEKKGAMLHMERTA